MKQIFTHIKSNKFNRLLIALMLLCGMIIASIAPVMAGNSVSLASTLQPFINNGNNGNGKPDEPPANSNGQDFVEICHVAGPADNPANLVTLRIAKPALEAHLAHGDTQGACAVAPTETPTDVPTETPTDVPTDTPTDVPTDTPTDVPTDTPTDVPTDTPTNTPTDTPTDTPTNTPTDTPTNTPTNTPMPSCAAATQVYAYYPGTASTGTIDPAYTDPSKALGFADGQYVALGFKGRLLLQFANPILNGAGADFTVVEVSPAGTNIPLEKALVRASIDGSIWFNLGTAQEDGSFDLDVASMTSATYVQIIDNTDDSLVPSGTYADGYDVDAIEVINCG